jgi:hypothetical protein
VGHDESSSGTGPLLRGDRDGNGADPSAANVAWVDHWAHCEADRLPGRNEHREPSTLQPERSIIRVVGQRDCGLKLSVTVLGGLILVAFQNAHHGQDRVPVPYRSWNAE